MSDSEWPHRLQPTSSPIPEILQARTVEWVAISFSNTRKWKVKVKSLTRVRLCATPWSLPPGKFQTVNFITCLLDEWMNEWRWSVTHGFLLPRTSDKLFHFPGPPFLICKISRVTRAPIFCLQIISSVIWRRNFSLLLPGTAKYCSLGAGDNGVPSLPSGKVRASLEPSMISYSVAALPRSPLGFA